MFTKNSKVDVKAISVEATEARNDNQNKSGYSTPELHVVGKAVELVQGNFGYTDRDGRYYWR